MRSEDLIKSLELRTRKCSRSSLIWMSRKSLRMKIRMMIESCSLYALRMISKGHSQMINSIKILDLQKSYLMYSKPILYTIIHEGMSKV
jgi:hypothetical protein